MYLIEIDKETGLIEETPVQTGWVGIKAFRDLYKKKGLKAMTAVALIVDYQSPLRHYSEKDRPHRAIEEVYGKRSAINTSDELFVAAMKKYAELQLDPDLQTEKINREIKLRLLDKIQEANENEDDPAIERYRKSLANHEAAVESFNKRFDKKVALDKAVTVTGYELTRIENDIKSRKKSKFVNHGEGAENPGKLEF